VDWKFLEFSFFVSYPVWPRILTSHPGPEGGTCIESYGLLLRVFQLLQFKSSARPSLLITFLDLARYDDGKGQAPASAPVPQAALPAEESSEAQAQGRLRRERRGRARSATPGADGSTASRPGFLQRVQTLLVELPRLEAPTPNPMTDGQSKPARQASESKKKAMPLRAAGPLQRNGHSYLHSYRPASLSVLDWKQNMLDCKQSIKEKMDDLQQRQAEELQRVKNRNGEIVISENRTIPSS
jgi:hypothetical protein